MNTTGW